MEESSSATKPNDVLDLNVGGQKLSVSRQTLTCVPGSMLEGLFSGRWDAGIAKDKNGNFFIDQPFDLFEAMINFLRATFLEMPGSKSTLSPDFKEHHAKQQHFRRIVEYYGMTSTIFPTKLTVYRGQEKDVDMLDDLKVESTSKLTTFNVQTKGHQREICTFEITFEKVESTSIRVGWMRNNEWFPRNTLENTKGVGSTEGTIALSYSFPSTFDVALYGAYIAKIPHDPPDGTVLVVRCEAFGKRWYVDGELVLSIDPNDGLITLNTTKNPRRMSYPFDLVPGLEMVPAISANGPFHVSDVVYSED
jgi:hypothetical protein